jgi:hypothetical protein
MIWLKALLWRVFLEKRTPKYCKEHYTYQCKHPRP